MSTDNKLFKVLDEYIYFDNAQDSQDYAKNNPGKIVVRNKAINDNLDNSKVFIKKPFIDKTPKKILEFLNQHIISQDEAKKEIALAMYYHNLKLKYPNNRYIGVNGPIMIVGPTGSGKTLIVKKACEYIDTVFIHVDTSSMVPEGIQGYSIGSLARDILNKADYNMHKASHCVVFFDEMDKLFNNNDASKYGGKVANQLLRLIEGSKVQLSNDIIEKNLNNTVDELDTSNMQFILGGAFQWILNKKLDKKETMGFNNQEVKDSSNKITLENLYEENIPKELLGRMSTIVNLKKLTADDYFNILTNSKNSSLTEFINKIEFHGDKVEISDETLRQVSKVVAESELGVRAIQQTLKSMFSNALFSTADGECKTYTIKYQSI